MLDRLLKKPLRLELPDRTVAFDSPSDFEFSLASRIEVPAAKVGELMSLDADALRGEATSIRAVERRFVEVLAKSLEESGAIGYLMREMDPKLFSQDHQWRAIMTSLVKQGREYDEFKKVALVKYMQYLGSRQDVLRSVYSLKPRAGAVPVDAEADTGAEAAHKETVIFDVAHVAASPPPRDDLDADEGADEIVGDEAQTRISRPRIERLPRGETIRVRLRDGDTLRLILSRHPFSLVAGERTRLVDDAGPEHLLRAGRNVVGREPDSDVVIDSGYRDVSRKHLVIDLPGDQTAHITDLSSHGTFLESTARAERSVGA